MRAYIGKGMTVHQMYWSKYVSDYRYTYCNRTGEKTETQAPVDCKACLRELAKRGKDA